MSMLISPERQYPEGTREGFYPVIGGKYNDTPQLWVPEGLQKADTIEFVKQNRNNIPKPDVIIGIARGGVGFAMQLNYLYKVKRMLMMQTDGFDNDNNPLETPRIIAAPRDEDIADAKVIWLADELVDNFAAIPVAGDYLAEHAPNACIISIVQYRKRKLGALAASRADYEHRIVEDIWLDFETQASIELLERRHAELPEAYPNYQSDIGMYATWAARKI